MLTRDVACDDSFFMTHMSGSLKLCWKMEPFWASLPCSFQNLNRIKLWGGLCSVSNHMSCAIIYIYNTLKIQKEPVFISMALLFVFVNVCFSLSLRPSLSIKLSPWQPIHTLLNLIPSFCCIITVCFPCGDINDFGFQYFGFFFLFFSFSLFYFSEVFFFFFLCGAKTRIQGNRVWTKVKNDGRKNSKLVVSFSKSNCKYFG